jgi:alpha-1,2-mannosyltransferase
VVAAASTLFAVANAYGWSIGRRQVDLEVYLMGGRFAFSPTLYTTSQMRWPHLPFTYPPFAAVLFAPVSHFNYRFDQFLSDSVNLLALAGLLAVTVANLRPASPAGRVSWTLVGVLLGPSVLLEPIMMNFSFGQVNIVLGLLVLADLTGTVTVAGRRLPRGLLLGIAAAVKLVPLIFVLYLALSRQGRSAARAALTFLICSVAPVIGNPTSWWAYWTKYDHDVTRIGRVSYISNQSVLAMVDRMTHRPHLGLAVTAGEALIAGLGAWVGAWWYLRGDEFAGVLVVAVAGTLASPISWCHHLVWVVPVVLWLWWSAPGRFHRWWAGAVAVLYFDAPMWQIRFGDRFDLHERGWQIVAGSAFAEAALVFVAVMAWSGRPSKRRLVTADFSAP